MSDPDDSSVQDEQAEPARGPAEILTEITRRHTRPDSGEWPSMLSDDRNFCMPFAKGDDSVLVDARGLTLLEHLIEAVERDPQVIAAGTVGDVRSEINALVVQAYLDEQSGDLDAQGVLDGAIARLASGPKEWYILAPLPGLELETDTMLTIAGIELGRVTSNERAQYAADVDRRAGGNVPSNSFAGQQIAGVQRAMDTIPCWARLHIRAQGNDVSSIADERLTNLVALLRLFAGAKGVGVDPDQTHLGEFIVPGGREAVRYLVREDGSLDADSVGGLWKRHDVRRTLELDEGRIQALTNHPHFRRAEDIVSAPPSNSMERKLLLAMRQYSAASAFTAREVKLQNYLTVIEMLYAFDDAEYGDRAKKAAQRLAISVPADRRTDFEQACDAAYRPRRKPVHYGERALWGEADLVTDADVELAQQLAFRAVMFALERSPGLDTHDALVKSLQREVENQRREVSYVVTTLTDPTSGTIVATAPDFPSCRGEGSTREEAMKMLRQQMEAYIMDAVTDSEHHPMPNAKTHKELFRLPKLRDPRGANGK